MKHDKKNITAMVTGMVIGAALASGTYWAEDLCGWPAGLHDRL